MARPVSAGGRSPFSKKAGSPFGGNRPIKGGKGGKGILGLAGDATKAGAKALLSMAQSNAPVIPFSGGASPSVGQTTRAAAAMGAEQTGIPLLERAVTGKAGKGELLLGALSYGPGAAVVLPLRGRSGMFARLAKAANEPQLVGPDHLPGTAIGGFPILQGTPKGKGRTYVVNMGRAPGAEPHELDRVIAVQDSKSGNIFLAAGGWHHANLQSYLARKHGLGGEGANWEHTGTGEGWMQHELFRAVPSEDIPARFNFDVWGKNAHGLGGMGLPGTGADTRAATFGRMRMIRALQQKGVRLAPPERAGGNYGRF